MLQYRVTKYNPAHRDAAGSYTLDEWSSFADIGQRFDGVRLTPEVYQTVEDAYVRVAQAFLEEAGVPSLCVIGLEAPTNDAPLAEGAHLSLPQIDSVLRALLRERYWCRLECELGFIHVGWDYYMYVGVSCQCPGAEALAKAYGLYVENFSSPYAKSAV